MSLFAFESLYKSHPNWLKQSVGVGQSYYLKGKSLIQQWLNPHIARTSAEQGAVITYATGVGERQEVQLADGSRIQLNTNTRIVVDFDDQQRYLTLIRGEVLITSASDSRPLKVTTRQGEIRASVARFLVRCDEGITRTTVYEHTVNITPKKWSRNLILQAGQQVAFTSDQLDSMVSVPASTDSWINGILVVNHWRLDELLQELSRYHYGKLFCDVSIAELRVSGTYQLNDIDSILTNLKLNLPIEVHYCTRFLIKIGRR